METCLTSPTFPLELKKRILEIMHEEKCNLFSAEQKLISELLEKLR